MESSNDDGGSGDLLPSVPSFGSGLNSVVPLAEGLSCVCSPNNASNLSKINTLIDDDVYASSSSSAMIALIVLSALRVLVIPACAC